MWSEARLQFLDFSDWLRQLLLPLLLNVSILRHRRQVDQKLLNDKTRHDLV